MNERPLSLLYLLPAEAFGGAERQGVLHLAELPKHGVDVTALVGPGEPIFRALERAGVCDFERFEHFPDRTHAPMSAARNAAFLGAWFAKLKDASAAIERRISRQHFDLLFANRTFAWLCAARVSRRLGIPYVIRAGSRPSHPAFALALPLLSSVAPPAALVSNCRAVERTIRPWLSCRAEVVVNGVDCDAFLPGARGPARERLRLPPGAPLVGLAARPSPEKGLEFLARVAARVRSQDPRVRFVCAGEFGWRSHYQGSLEAVDFVGHLDDMVDFYRAMDVVVLTSRASSIEGSPNALLEAMAVEKPVVATAVGGVPELVSEGETGFLTDANDDRKFATHLTRLLDDRGLRERLGRAARASVLARHRGPLVVAELSGLLRQLVSRKERCTCESNTLFAPPSIC